MPGHYPVHLTPHSPHTSIIQAKGSLPPPNMSTSTLMFRCPASFWDPPRADHQLSPLQRMPHGMPFLPAPEGALWPCSDHHHCGPSQTLSPNPMPPGTWNPWASQFLGCEIPKICYPDHSFPDCPWTLQVLLKEGNTMCLDGLFSLECGCIKVASESYKGPVLRNSACHQVSVIQRLEQSFSKWLFTS